MQPALAQNNNIDVFSPESRHGLAKMVTRLFQLWDIPTADQLNLLGLSQNSRALLGKYRSGSALPESRDTLDRVGWLLAIHKGLGLLYPYNENIKYSWVTRRNKAFGNLTPLDVMKEQGIIGIARVARYIDFYRGL